ncbi:MAG: LlaJI family restriction endonuclease [Treponema sp.]|nr:LlaJI family restriction endonuclease [Treponema sp.]
MGIKSEARQKKQSLSDLCVYFDGKSSYNEESGQVDKFVGLRFVNGKLSIHFPVGYKKPESSDEKQIRLDVLNLISVLSSFALPEAELGRNDFRANSEHVEFPIHAYLFIISDFFNHGYYQQREQIYKRSTNGKINWSRTIKHIRPQIANESPVYLEFVTQRTLHKENALLTLIHKYCVYESFQKLGFLFGSYKPQKPELAFNKSLFSSVIKSKIASTFNEKDLLLFKNMLDMINYLDNSIEKKDFIYGTNNFHHIWEQLVDSVYGEKDKEKFYPKVYWRFNGSSKAYEFDSEKRSSLRPDTIMITNRGKPEQKIFVLDSKYYRYGATKNPNHLPDNASVVKQLAYADYIDNKDNRNKLPKDVRDNISDCSIYNAFIMPAENAGPENIGYVSADYVLPQDFTTAEKTYHKIYGILLDVRSLMYRHVPRDKHLISQLAKLIDQT